MTWRGFKFGMLLQLAVGPMCLLVFTTSTSQGFYAGLSLVLAIALIDALYIALSGFGIAALIGKEKVKYVIKIFGGIVLILFGFNYVIGIFDFTILPNIIIHDKAIGLPSSLLDNYISNQNIFLQGLILTASNPLTIIFWSGVFSTQIIENELTKKQLCFFGIGCVFSTLIFLSVVALLGNVLSGFFPTIIIKIFNGAVGLVIMFFGVKLFFKK